MSLAYFQSIGLPVQTHQVAQITPTCDRPLGGAKLSASTAKATGGAVGGARASAGDAKNILREIPCVTGFEQYGKTRYQVVSPIFCQAATPSVVTGALKAIPAPGAAKKMPNGVKEEKKNSQEKPKKESSGAGEALWDVAEYSKFDAEGIPTHDKAGEALSKSAYKKLKKLKEVADKKAAKAAK